MKFLCYTSGYYKSVCCGMPLKVGTVISFLFALIFNIAIIILVNIFTFWINEIRIYYTTLASVQIVLIMFSWIFVHSFSFKKCYYANLMFQCLFIFDILTISINVLACFGIGLQRKPLDTYTIVTSVSFWIFYMLITYNAVFMLYSFTKNLGLALNLNLNYTTDGFVSSEENNSVRYHKHLLGEKDFSRTSSSFFCCDKIVLSDPNDLIFVNTIQNSIVDNVVLPSGVVVPGSVNGMRWRVIGNEILLL
jgi:hypothetical protein